MPKISEIPRSSNCLEVQHNDLTPIELSSIYPTITQNVLEKLKKSLPTVNVFFKSWTQISSADHL